MLSRIRPRLTYANVVASIALFVVLGGGAYATIDRKIGTSDLRKGAVTTPKLGKQAVKAGKLAKDSVRPPKIRDGAVNTNKLGDESVTGSKVSDGAVSTSKLSDGAVSTSKLSDGAVSTSKLADGAVTDLKLANPILWARVLANGTLDRNKGVTNALRINNGNYRVVFGTDISQCTFQVTPENVGQNLTAHADVDVTNNQRAFVSLRNAANATRTDGNFQLALFC
jgi:trimeric autotransporter adhesin